MRVTPTILALGLAPIMALAGCEDPAAGPGLEVTDPSNNVVSRTPAGKAGPEFPGPRGPAEILALSEELGLSVEQRSAIEAIALELEERNEPLWAELRGDGPGSGPVQGGPSPRVDPDDPTMQAIRDNTRTATREAIALLTSEQARLFADLRAEPDPGRIEDLAPPTGFQPGTTILGTANTLGLGEAQIDELRAIFGAGLRGPEAIPAVESVLTAEQLERLRSILRDRRLQGPGPWTP